MSLDKKTKEVTLEFHARGNDIAFSFLKLKPYCTKYDRLPKQSTTNLHILHGIKKGKALQQLMSMKPDTSNAKSESHHILVLNGNYPLSPLA